MKYRREIDGLRTLAVVPVILFHAGFSVFRGGFFGVDVFFVISGYLITTIILGDLERGKFSIVKFYERRSRRILPALFTVMTVSTILAYRLMLPDELKNYGQSIVATTLFSNNILLAMTSGYWSLASEFKPLLHTWSLGVEEQYYIFFPLLLMLCWAFLRKRIVVILSLLGVMSFIAGCWGVYHSPDKAFYLLPTRAWEIMAGAVAAYSIKHRTEPLRKSVKVELLSGLGFLLILASIFCITADVTKSLIYAAIPVLGSVLIILYASAENLAGRILGNRVMVGIGLISYSCYLWHQPLFAFARVYSKNRPGPLVYLVLTALTFVLSYLSWRFIEQPFRDRQRITERTVFTFAGVVSLVFIAFGLYLNHSYGMLSRIYDPRLAPISSLDKRIYNERVYQYKKDQFPDTTKLKILVMGNSFGRDIVNMTTETFGTKNFEIIYRNDVGHCILPYKSSLEEGLFSKADVIVFANSAPSPCNAKDVDYAQQNKKAIFFMGAKEFGYNLNWIMRLKSDERANQYNDLLPDMVEEERRDVEGLPKDHYISLIGPVVRNGMIPITDERGYLLSPDRVHVTRFGAIYFGREVLLHSPYGEILTKVNAAAANRVN